MMLVINPEANQQMIPLPLFQESMMVKKTVNDTGSEASRFVLRDGVTMVDFNAPWCAPCREQQPVIEKVADSFRGRALVFDVNVDEHPDPAMSLGVASVPTLIIFKDGTERQRFIGVQSEETLARSLEEALRD